MLKEDIQGGGGKGHDSVEDARTAIRLWRKWEEFGRDKGDKGREKVVEDVYRVGRRLGFKPPPPPMTTTTMTTMMNARMEIEGKGRVMPPIMGEGVLTVAVTTSASASAPLGSMLTPPEGGGGGGVL